MPFERPSGTPYFKLVNDLCNWTYNPRDSPPPVRSVFEKANGFHVQIIPKILGMPLLKTKNGHEYDPRKTTRLGKLGKIMLEKFIDPIRKAVVHSDAGRVVAIYAELTCDPDGNGDNLQAMMTGNLEELSQHAEWRLRVFECEFANAQVRVPLVDKLALFSELWGPAFVVRTLIDTRHPVTQQHLNALDDCMNTTEGVVAITHRGWKVKHKIGLPVPLWLVAVGFTQIGTASVPTHFAWAVKNGDSEYAVVLIDCKGHLCDQAREAQKKMYISPMEFNCQKEYDGWTVSCSNQTFAGQNYDAILTMAGKLVEPESYADTRLCYRNRVFTVNAGRKINFASAMFKAVRKISIGVVTANELWINKHGDVGDVHFQAPQFAACLGSKPYGHPIHQMLIPGYTDPGNPYLPKTSELTPERLLRLARMPHNASAHARLVYCYDGNSDGLNVDLAGGEIVEEDDDSPYSTPMQSESEDDEEFKKRKFEDSAIPNKRRCAMGWEPMSSVLMKP
jgi:hypothetical protein